jgi:tetratricopeptide (TPR) repeat protein
MLKERGGAEFGDVRLDHAYARCLVQAGRFLEALPFALRAHKAAPANPAFSRTLGLCLMGANRFGEAAQMLHAGRSVSGDAAGDAELHLQLGEALFQGRRWEAAEEAWLAGITRHSRSYPLYARLVDYYLGINRPRQAARVVDFARGENPGHPGNLLLEVRLHRKLGDYAQSRKALVRLKRQACGSLVQEALWEEAQLEYETGRFTACGKILDRLLAKGKSEAFPRLGEANLLKAKVYGRSAGRSPKPESEAKGSSTRPNPESLRAGRM